MVHCVNEEEAISAFSNEFLNMAVIFKAINSILADAMLRWPTVIFYISFHHTSIMTKLFSKKDVLAFQNQKQNKRRFGVLH